MTDTMTADTTATMPGPDVSGADPTEGKTLATIRPDQRRFDDNQLAILRQHGIEDAPQGDLDLFFHYCRTTNLDPFRKQIYMIGRNTKITEYVPRNPNNPDGPKDKKERWVTKYTIQMAIDGYRSHGNKIAARAGDTVEFEGPFLCGDDGEWREVLPNGVTPLAAKFVIRRNGVTYSAVAHFEEFVQTNAIYQGTGQDRHKTGEEPNSMWRKAPRHMIEKCAEALAWRRAYPDDFAGLEPETGIVIDQEGNVEESKTRRGGGSGINGVRAAREQREQRRAAKAEPDIVDAEEVPPADQKPYDPNQVSPPTDPARRKTLNNMHRLFGLADIDKDNREDRLIVTRKIIQRAEGGAPIDSSNDLTDRELAYLVSMLDKANEAGTLGKQVTDVLNSHSLAQAEAEANQ